MRKTVAIFTSEPPTSPGGVEHVVREIESGLSQRGYEVRTLHRGNAAPGWIRQPRHFLSRHLSDLLLSWYVGENLRLLKDRELVAVISNGPIGWHIPRVKRHSTKALQNRSAPEGNLGLSAGAGDTVVLIFAAVS